MGLMVERRGRSNVQAQRQLLRGGVERERRVRMATPHWAEKQSGGSLERTCSASCALWSEMNDAQRTLDPIGQLLGHRSHQ
jgi:hypothetical protein